jgi:hypothetical protein
MIRQAWRCFYTSRTAVHAVDNVTIILPMPPQVG